MSLIRVKGSVWNAEDNGQVTSVIEFGAKGDGSTPDSAAIQAALDAVVAAGQGTLYFPAGEYLLDAQIYASFGGFKRIAIYGDGPASTRLVVDNITGGIELYCTARTSPVTLRELTIVSKVQNGGTAFKCWSVYPPSGTQTRRMFEATNVHIQPYQFLATVDQGFNKYLVVENTFRPYINNVVISAGFDSTINAAVGISVDGCWVPHIENCYVHHRNTSTMEVGISDVWDYETPHAQVGGEGANIINCVINGPKIGYKRIRGSREPQFVFDGNHVNCTEIGVYLDGVKYGQFVNNLMYTTGTGTYQDFRVFNAEGLIFDNNIYRQESSPARTNIYLDTSGSEVHTPPAIIRDIKCTDFGLQAKAASYVYATDDVTHLEIILPADISEEIYVAYASFILGNVTDYIINRPVQNYYPVNYGAVGDGSTDDTLELQATIDAAEAMLSDNLRGYVQPAHITVDLRGKLYAISDELTITRAIRVINGSFIARSDFSGTATSMLDIADTARNAVIENVGFDGGVTGSYTHYADQCLENNARNVHLTNLTVTHFNNFGIRMAETGQCRVSRCTIFQWLFYDWYGNGESGEGYGSLVGNAFRDHGVFTGTGLSVEDADGIFSDLIINMCLKEIVATSTSDNCIFQGCHPWTQLADTDPPAEHYIVDDSGDGNVYTSCYLDGGCVRIQGGVNSYGFNKSFNGCLFTGGTVFSGTNRIELLSAVANENAAGLSFIGCTFKGSVANAEIQTNGDFEDDLIDSSADGSGTSGWSWANSGWSVVAGKHAKALQNDEVLTSDDTATVGEVYEVIYTIGVADLAGITCGDVSLANVTVGTHTEVITATGATSLFIATADNPHNNATLDNISIKRYKGTLISFTVTGSGSWNFGNEKYNWLGLDKPKDSGSHNEVFRFNNLLSADDENVTIRKGLVHIIDTLFDQAEPSITGGHMFKTGGTTPITDFINGVLGQEITILASHSITITNNENIVLDGSQNFDMADGDTLMLIRREDDVWYETGRLIQSPIKPDTIYTLATGTATPSILDGTVFTTATGTAITDFADGITGQEIEILAQASRTITNNTNIILKNGIDFSMQDGDTLTLRQKSDTYWYEVSRTESTRVDDIITLEVSATPDVQYGNTFITNVTTTNITDFSNAYTGQEILVLANSSVTIDHGANIKLNDNIDFAMVTGDTLTLAQRNNGIWYETGRLVQSPVELDTIYTLGTGNTPSVSSGKVFKVTTATTGITNFTNGVDGQVIELLINPATGVVVFDGSSATLNIAGGVDWRAGIGDSITLRLDGTIWNEISRNAGRHDISLDILNALANTGAPYVITGKLYEPLGNGDINELRGGYEGQEIEIQLIDYNNRFVHNYTPVLGHAMILQGATDWYAKTGDSITLRLKDNSGTLKWYETARNDGNAYDFGGIYRNQYASTAVDVGTTYIKVPCNYDMIDIGATSSSSSNRVSTTTAGNYRISFSTSFKATVTANEDFIFELIENDPAGPTEYETDFTSTVTVVYVSGGGSDDVFYTASINCIYYTHAWNSQFWIGVKCGTASTSTTFRDVQLVVERINADRVYP